MTPPLDSDSRGPREGGDMPLFRFVQINDTHIQEGPQAYALTREKVMRIVDDINGEKRFPLPDFMVGVGDLINGEHLDRLACDFRAFLNVIEPLRCPFYPVVGNHEVVQREGDPVYEKPYRDAFGSDKLNYSFAHKGILFVAVNNSGACVVGKEVSRARNDWLRGVLNAARGLPKIICCHIPLVVLRQEKALIDSFGFRSYIDHELEMLSIIESHRDTIIAVLSGHLHLTGVARHRSIFHISISGTASYPCDYALYTVFDDRIKVNVTQVPDELATPATNIHGKRRHGVDYVDADHRTHEDYVRGLPSERDFVMPLKGAKQPLNCS